MGESPEWILPFGQHSQEQGGIVGALMILVGPSQPEIFHDSHFSQARSVCVSLFYQAQCACIYSTEWELCVSTAPGGIISAKKPELDQNVTDVL